MIFIIICCVFVVGFFVFKFFFVGGIYCIGIEFVDCFFECSNKFVVKDFFVFIILFVGLYGFLLFLNIL